jgi:hypothetical protein
MTELTPLPEGGKERRIFLVALQEYRDSCLPPELTPDCPFYTWTANGPACGEQCLDLLAMHGRNDAPDPIDLGDGIAVVRSRPPRRPRRGPSPDDKPFDAREIFLSNEHRPHADRPTVALIVELDELINQPPTRWSDADERAYDIRTARDQLHKRGFDVEALIRYGLGSKLSMNITVNVLLPMMEEEVLRPMIEAGKSIPPADGDWQKYFDAAFAADTGSVDANRTARLNYAFLGFLDRIRTWLTYADIDDIIMWTVPPLDFAVNDGEEEKSLRAESRTTAFWAFQRFTGAYVRDWSLSSLHQEWLYLHGRQAGPCSPAAMAERRINAPDINAAIAEQTTNDWTRRKGSKKYSIAGDFIAVAEGHLRNGRPDLAAAIFEALTHVDSSDAEAINNYGFCLMAFDAAAALEVLETANRMFKGKHLTNIADRVLALHLLGRNDDAYTLGISEETRSLPSSRGLMWLVGEDDALELSQWIDVRPYLGTLIAHMDHCDRGYSPESALQLKVD